MVLLPRRECLVGMLCLVLHSPTIRAQSEKPVAGETPLEVFERLVKKKKQDDAAASVDALVKLHQECTDDKERDRIVKALERSLNVPVPEVHVAVLRAFPSFGADGEKLLLRALKVPYVEKNPEPLAAALESLGTYKKPRHIKLFLGFLNRRSAPVVNAAIRALGEYEGENERSRKEIASELIQAYSASAVARSGNVGTGQQFGMDNFIFEVRESYLVALARISGGTYLTTVQEWRDWYGLMKDKPWPPGGWQEARSKK